MLAAIINNLPNSKGLKNKNLVLLMWIQIRCACQANFQSLIEGPGLLSLMAPPSTKSLNHLQPALPFSREKRVWKKFFMGQA